jgi:PAS domain S-box-containing protein
LGWLLMLCVGLAPVLTARPLRIGVELQAPPMAFVDAQGQPAGFSADLLRAMAATGLVEVEIVPGFWTDHLADLQLGKIDALANVVYRPGRIPVMDYSIGHAKVHGVAYRRPDHPPLRRTADFAGKTLGALGGTIAYNHAAAHPGWGATLRRFDTWQEALDATARGEIDATIMLSPLTSQMGDLHDLRADFVDDIIHQYHFAVRQGDSETLAALNEALATVRHNGDFDRIYAKWIGPIEPQPIRWADLKPYRLPALAVVLLLVALFAWQRRMLRRLARQTEDLRISEERLKFALEGSGDGIWDWEASTGRILRSKLWMEMLGYAEDEIGPGMDEWLGRVHPDDLPAVRAVQEANVRGETPSFSIEHRMRCKDGTWKWILNRGMVVRRDSAGRPLRIIGTHTDLTDRKQAEDDRLILGKLESTGVLAGGIAHDFNNLLTAILLNLELAQISMDKPGEVLRRVEGAQKAALSARSLTHQLITFARGGAADPRVTDISGLLRESVPLALTGSNVRAEVRIAPDLWPVKVDAGQIGQVIRNLVLNAREVMPDGGVVTLQAENTVVRAGDGRALPAGDYLHLAVSDEGAGIAPEVLPKIFDPYFSTKQRGPQRGMGLGLTICHSIIQKHGGSITVESVPRRGTTFHVYLPATPEGPAGMVAPAPARPSLRALRPARILVMDDEPAIQTSMVRALEEMGLVAEVAADGRSAIEQYACARADGRPFDAVLLDLTVPGGMGGLDALRAMRATDPAVKAVVMSGFTNDQQLHDSVGHGFKAALRKPFDLAALQDVLFRVLEA